MQPLTFRGDYRKLSGLKDWVARRIGQKRDLTVAELAAEIVATHGTAVHRGSVWRLLRDLGLTHKKNDLHGEPLMRHWFEHNGG